MPRLKESPSASTRTRDASPAQPQAAPVDGNLSENAMRAIEEGRKDHAAGRTYSLDEIKRELGIES